VVSPFRVAHSTGDRYANITPSEYSKSVSLIARHGNSMDVATVLLCTILFVYYESMSGHSMAAIDHMLAALRIYSALDFSQSSGTVNEVIKPILYRLRTTAVVMDARPFHGLYKTTPESTEIKVASFRDADREIGAITSATSDVAHSYLSLTPGQLKSHLDHLQDQFETWSRAYSQFLRNSGVLHTESDIRYQIVMSYLDMRSTLFQIRITGEAFSADTIFSEHHLVNLRRVLSACRSLMRSLHDDPCTLEAISNSLKVDIDLAPVLGFILSHSKDAYIETTALQLLRNWCDDFGSRAGNASLLDLDMLSDILGVVYGPCNAAIIYEAKEGTEESADASLKSIKASAHRSRNSTENLHYQPIARNSRSDDFFVTAGASKPS
jgi:hypothetical protein